MHFLPSMSNHCLMLPDWVQENQFPFEVPDEMCCCLSWPARFLGMHSFILISLFSFFMVFVLKIWGIVNWVAYSHVSKFASPASNEGLSLASITYSTFVNIGSNFFSLRSLSFLLIFVLLLFFGCWIWCYSDRLVQLREGSAFTILMIHSKVRTSLSNYHRDGSETCSVISLTSIL